MSIHVVPMGNQWVVRFHGQTISNHRLKHRAKDKGRREARNKGVPLVVHRSDGTVQNNRSYGRGGGR